MVQLHTGERSALKEALRSFTVLEDPTYANKNLGSSGQLEVMTCECGNSEHTHSNGSRHSKSTPKKAKEGDDDEDEELCGADSNCINRLTYMECYDEYCCDANCGNRRFQKHQHAKLDVFHAGKKGYGVRALESISEGSFLYEYTGEVLDEQRFQRRQQKYDREGVKHFYFMMLQKDEFIDATEKGSIARFCNHSCNPNAQIEKWVVGPKLRMGLFAKRDIQKGEEICFDYKVDRYGSKAQPCYCGEANCSGFLGGRTQTGGTLLPPSVVEGLGLDSDTALNWPENALQRLQSHLNSLGQDLESVLQNANDYEDQNQPLNQPPNQSQQSGGSGSQKKSRRSKNKTAELIVLLDAPPSSLSEHRRSAQQFLISLFPLNSLDIEQLPELMRILMQTQIRAWFMSLMLERVAISDHSIQLSILRMHGYEIMATVLNRWRDYPSVVEKGLSVLQKWPTVTRNKISSSKIESVIRDITNRDNVETGIKTQASNLLEEWKGLSMGYRIPRRKITDAVQSNNCKGKTDVETAANNNAHTTVTPTTTISTTTNTIPTVAKSDSRSPQPKHRTPVLPEGWEAITRPDGVLYYYNKAEDITSWKPPRDPRDIEKEARIREKQQKLEKEQQVLLQEERQRQANEIQRIIDEAEGSTTIASPSSSSNTPTSQKSTKERRGERNELRDKPSSLTAIFAAYVPKLVYASEDKLGRDRCKRHARDVVHILVKKEETKGTDPAKLELTTERKNKIKAFVKDYMGKVFARHEAKSKSIDDSNAYGTPKKAKKE